MRFEYNDKTHTVIDHENKIRVSVSSKSYDTDHLNYEYADEHVAFDFAAFEASAKRIVSVASP